MNKPKPLHISIPNPCFQNWDGMTPNVQGRHCDHCQKTVIDFTTWSDAALYNFFSKNTGNTCGRFLSSQIDHPINIPYQPHSRLYRIAIALGLTLMFTQTPDLLAQNRPPRVENSSFLKQNNPAGDQFGKITGAVFDDKKEPLPSAVIQVFKNGILVGGNVTDYDGNYFINSLETGIYDVVALYTGYDSISTKASVYSDKHTTLNFELKQSPNQQNKPVITHFLGKVRLNSDNPTKRTFTREEINNTPH